MSEAISGVSVLDSERSPDERRRELKSGKRGPKPLLP